MEALYRHNVTLYYITFTCQDMAQVLTYQTIFTHLDIVGSGNQNVRRSLIAPISRPIMQHIVDQLHHLVDLGGVVERRAAAVLHLLAVRVAESQRRKSRRRRRWRSRPDRLQTVLASVEDPSDELDYLRMVPVVRAEQNRRFVLLRKTEVSADQPLDKRDAEVLSYGLLAVHLHNTSLALEKQDFMHL